MRSFKFAFRVNNFSAAFAFRLRLLGDGALHILRNIDLFDLNLRYLDTPRLRILVKDLLQLGVNLFALGENRVQFELAYQAAQGGLRELGSCVQVILDLRESEIRVYHAEIADRVYLHGDVVARDHVLRRHVERFDSQGDARELVDRERRRAAGPRLLLREACGPGAEPRRVPIP